MNTSISDKTFLLTTFRTISAMPREADRLDAIRALLNHTDAGEGGYYDYLAGDAPHLDPGEGADKDPAYYFTPLVAGPSAKSVDPMARLSWSSFAMSFFDATSVSLDYNGLDPRKTYEAVVVFNANAEPAARSRLSASGDGPTSGNPNQMRLFVDGGHVVWPDPPLNYSYAPTPMQKTRINIPRAATQDGRLKLTCDQPPGIPGNGRTCEIVEVWLRVVAQ